MDIRALLVKKYGKHPQLDVIVEEVNALISRIDTAYDAWDRPAFVKACADLKMYQPPRTKK